MARLYAQADVGTRIGNGDPQGGGGREGSVRDVLGPDTEHGQAIAIAAAGLGLLYLTVGARHSGILAKSGAVLEFVAIIAAGSWTANYLARSYVLMHPDAPFAMGFHFDA